MNDFKVKPAPGKVVRDPRTMNLLSAEGESKPRNTYWLRRVKASDVIVLNAPEKKGKAQ